MSKIVNDPNFYYNFVFINKDKLVRKFFRKNKPNFFFDLINNLSNKSILHKL